MPDDAMEAWRREYERAASRSEPPPTPEPSFVAFAREAPPRPATVLLIPMAAGIVVAVAVLVLQGWAEALFPVSPVFALVPLSGAGLAFLFGRRGAGAFGWAVTASAAGACAVGIILPVWALLDLLECWMSWLSDC